MDIYSILSSARYEPAVAASLTYAGVFAFAHLARKASDSALRRHSQPHTFVMEAIAALQMCTCTYENGVIVANYGLYGFFVAVAVLLTAAGFMNRGAFGNILAYAERLWLGQITLTVFLTTLLGQLAGAYLAFGTANLIWHWTAPYSESHATAAASTCNLAFKVSVDWLPLVEAAFCFALRFSLGLFVHTEYRRKYLLPVVISAFLSAALRFIGVAGMNPLIAFARLTVCRGLTREHFYIVFWLASTLGWIAGGAAQRAFEKSWWNKKAKKAADKTKKSLETKNSPETKKGK